MIYVKELGIYLWQPMMQDGINCCYLFQRDWDDRTYAQVNSPAELLRLINMRNKLDKELTRICNKFQNMSEVTEIFYANGNRTKAVWYLGT